MKRKNFFTLFIACIFALTLVSCSDDDDVAPDFATQFGGTYIDLFGGTDRVSITKTGDNQVTLSNATGTALTSDLVVTLSNEKNEEVDIFGIKFNVTTYTSSNADVTLSVNTGSVLGQTSTTYDVIVTGASGDFEGTK